jgi:DNA-binding IscR family transcriptional regulator
VALYMYQFAYTAEAIAKMAKNPQDRRIPVRELAQQLGTLSPFSIS